MGLKYVKVYEFLEANTMKLRTNINAKNGISTNANDMGQLVYKHTSLEAHKCELGARTREALVTLGSGPNRIPR